MCLCSANTLVPQEHPAAARRRGPARQNVSFGGHRAGLPAPARGRVPPSVSRSCPAMEAVGPVGHRVRFQGNPCPVSSPAATRAVVVVRGNCSYRGWFGVLRDAAVLVLSLGWVLGRAQRVLQGAPPPRGRFPGCWQGKARGSTWKSMGKAGGSVPVPCSPPVAPPASLLRAKDLLPSVPRGEPSALSLSLNTR